MYSSASHFFFYAFSPVSASGVLQAGEFGFLLPGLFRNTKNQTQIEIRNTSTRHTILTAVYVPASRTANSPRMAEMAYSTATAYF